MTPSDIHEVFGPQPLLTPPDTPPPELPYTSDDYDICSCPPSSPQPDPEYSIMEYSPDDDLDDEVLDIFSQEYLRALQMVNFLTQLDAPLAQEQYPGPYVTIVSHTTNTQEEKVAANRARQANSQPPSAKRKR